MRKDVLDYLLNLAPPALAAAVFFLGAEYMGTGLLVPLAFGVNFLGHMAIKALVPDHSILRQIPWWLVFVLVAAVQTATVLFSNFYILGWWTPLAIIALLAVSAVVVMIADESVKKKNGEQARDQ